jgi:cytochrome c oxidase subunit 2
MRSRDVIHSAYLPHFRVQMNCVPGMITTFKFTPTKTTAEMKKDPYVVKMMAGINAQRAEFGKEAVEFDYLLLCNKICGASHYNMQMNVIVDTEADYNAWIAKQKVFKTAVATKN